MFHLDLKKAAVAIKSSRLDDAFELLTTSPERTHRDAQSMIDQLAKKYVERATEHLTNNRIQNAANDTDKAFRLVGASGEVAQLKVQVNDLLAAQQRQRQERQKLLQAVSEQAAAGRFSIGEQLLQELPDGQSASGVAAAEEAKNMLQRRRALVAETVRQVKALTKSKNFSAALSELRKLSAEEREVGELLELQQTAVRSLTAEATLDFSNGRLDRAMRLSNELNGFELPEAIDLRNTLRHSQTAQAALLRNDFQSADASMALVEQLTKARWVKEVRNAIQSAQQQLQSLRSSPLGLLVALDETHIPLPAKARVNPIPIRQPEPARNLAPVGTYFLQVDSVGGILLLTQDIVSIGEANSSTRFDIALQTQGIDVPLTLRRNGNDYFAESSQSFQVNGSATQQKLLQSSDTISLGQRGRLKFSRPVEASGSAILQLTGAKLGRSSIRSVVLMKDSLLFGPQGCHFRLDDMKSPVVLYCDAGEFRLRELGGESQPLPLARAIRFQDHNFFLET